MKSYDKRKFNRRRKFEKNRKTNENHDPERERGGNQDKFKKKIKDELDHSSYHKDTSEENIEERN